MGLLAVSRPQGVTASSTIRRSALRTSPQLSGYRRRRQLLVLADAGGAVGTGNDAGDGLTRNHDKAAKLAAMGITPVVGALDDGALLFSLARDVDCVISAASSDHRAAFAENGEASLAEIGEAIAGVS